MARVRDARTTCEASRPNQAGTGRGVPAAKNRRIGTHVDVRAVPPARTAEGVRVHDTRRALASQQAAAKTWAREDASAAASSASARVG
eukprot:4124846-Prymnesium_polylepis.1